MKLLKMKYITSLIVLVFISGSLLAQRGDYKDKIESLRIAFITEQLELSPEESQSFWPVYNGYMADLSGLRKKYKTNSSLELMEDSQLEQVLSNSIKKDEEELALKRNFMTDLRDILPLRKIVKLKSVEDDFKKRVLQRRRSNMREGNN